MTNAALEKSGFTSIYQFVSFLWGEVNLRIDLFRVSLVEKEQIDMFAPVFKTLPTDFEVNPRKDLLRLIFGNEIVFTGRGGVTYFYEVTSDDDNSDIISARIGKEIVSDENLSPEKNLEDVSRPTWKASNFLIDISKHDDGQKIGFEVDKAVGETGTILKYLFEHINRNFSQYGYSFFVRPIVDRNTFWSFVNKHEGNINQITFELIAPNMFGLRSDVDADMKSANKEENVTEATVKLESDTALKLGTDRVSDTVNYALEGGGKVTAKTRDDKRYNSSNKNKWIKIPKVDLDGLKGKELFEYLKKFFKSDSDG